MKKIILFTMFVVVTVVVFSQNSQQSETNYLFIIKEQSDIDNVFTAIKTRISNYNHFNCSIKNADNNTDTDFLAINKMPMGDNDIIMVQFQYNGKIISLILSKDEILGLTQEYKKNEIEKVYNIIYTLYSNNMLSTKR